MHSIRILAQLSAFTALILVAAASQADAQSPFYFEGHAAYIIPTGDLTEGDEFGGGADNGFGYGILAGFHLTPTISIYGGYERAAHFSDSETFEEAGYSIEVEGTARSEVIRIGGRIEFPSPAFSTFAHGGLVLGQLGYDLTMTVSGPGFSETDSESDSSDRNAGFELGGGIVYPLTPRLSLVPAVRYTTYPITFTEGGETWDDGDTADFFTLQIGLQFRP